MSFQRLGDILPQTLEGLGIADQVRQARVRRAWPRAAAGVSAGLAATSEATGLRGGSLTVRVSDRRFAGLIQACHAEIVAALNAELGEPVVERVVCAP